MKVTLSDCNLHVVPIKPIRGPYVFKSLNMLSLSISCMGAEPRKLNLSLLPSG
jgi:hypothetical protein